MSYDFKEILMIELKIIKKNSIYFILFISYLKKLNLYTDYIL